MFSTLLKEAKTYFSPHGLLVGFFPNLFAWGAVAVLLLFRFRGWDSSPEAVKAVNVWTQALIFGAFLGWVTLMAFLTLNFLPGLTRLFEGYAPRGGLLARLFAKSRRALVAECQIQEDATEACEARLSAIGRSLKALETMREQLQGKRELPREVVPAADLGTLEARLKVVAGLLEQIPSSVVSGEADKADAEASAAPAQDPLVWEEAVGQLVSLWLAGRNFWRAGKKPPVDSPEESVYLRLMEVTLGAQAKLESLQVELGERLQEMDHDLLLEFPAEQGQIVATRLGNVLKAAQLYSWERYGFDAVVLWPRLREKLPKEAAVAVESSRSSLDLTLVVSTFFILLGLPLACFLGSWRPAPLAHSAVEALPAAVLVAAMVALLARPEWRKIRGLGMALIVLGLGVVAARIAASVSSGWIASDLVALWFKLELTLGLAGIALFMSRLTYKNAVLAAVAYGERIKAAIDLYRCELLKALRLRLPTEFGEERALWKQVSVLTYRGFPPQGYPWQYTEPEEAIDKPAEPPERVELPVPKVPLAPWRPIVEGATEARELPREEITEPVVENVEELLGRFPSLALAAGEPIPRAAVLPLELLQGRVALSLPADEALLLGGALTAGDRVDLFVHPKAQGDESRPEAWTLEGVPVLAISEPESRQAGAAATLVLAVPAERRDAVLEAVETATIALSLPLS